MELDHQKSLQAFPAPYILQPRGSRSCLGREVHSHSSSLPSAGLHPTSPFPAGTQLQAHPSALCHRPTFSTSFSLPIFWKCGALPSLSCRCCLCAAFVQICIQTARTGACPSPLHLVTYFSSRLAAAPCSEGEPPRGSLRSRSNAGCLSLLCLVPRWNTAGCAANK